MKLLSIALFVCAVTMASCAEKDRIYDLEDAPALFEKFIKDFNRQYKDDEDKRVHYEAFKKNLAGINESNKKSSTASFDINNFADYTKEESQKMFGFGVRKN